MVYSQLNSLKATFFRVFGGPPDPPGGTPPGGVPRGGYPPLPGGVPPRGGSRDPPRRKGDLPGGFTPFRARGLAFDKGENPKNTRKSMFFDDFKPLAYCLFLIKIKKRLRKYKKIHGL